MAPPGPAATAGRGALPGSLLAPPTSTASRRRIHRSSRKLNLPGPGQASEADARPPRPVLGTQEGQQSRKINCSPGRPGRLFPCARKSINHIREKQGPWSQGSWLPTPGPSQRREDRGVTAVTAASQRQGQQCRGKGGCALVSSWTYLCLFLT